MYQLPNSYNGAVCTSVTVMPSLDNIYHQELFYNLNSGTNAVAFIM